MKPVSKRENSMKRRYEWLNQLAVTDLKREDRVRKMKVNANECERLKAVKTGEKNKPIGNERQ